MAGKVHLKHLSVATTEGYANPHQMGEKSQVACSQRRLTVSNVTTD